MIPCALTVKSSILSDHHEILVNIMCPVLNVNDKTGKRKISESAIGAFCRILKNQNWLLDESMTYIYLT